MQVEQIVQARAINLGNGRGRPGRRRFRLLQCFEKRSGVKSFGNLESSLTVVPIDQQREKDRERQEKEAAVERADAAEIENARLRARLAELESRDDQS